MIEIGRVCVKTAGRDAINYCAIVEIVDEKNVIVDGNTRRKKVNIAHIEPLSKVLKIKSGASTEEVLAELEKIGIAVKAKSDKPKEAKKAEAAPKKEKKTKAKAE